MANAYIHRIVTLISRGGFLLSKILHELLFPYTDLHIKDVHSLDYKNVTKHFQS